MAALHLLLLIDHHVVTQIVEAHLVIRAVGYVGGVCLLALVAFFFVNDKADGQAHEAIDLAHPFAVAAGKIIIDRDDVNAVAREGVKIGGEGRHKGLAFTRFHLGDPALMQDDAADYLHGEVLQPEHAPRSLTAGGKRLGENIVKGLSVCKSLLEFGGLCLQFGVGQFGKLLIEGEHPVAKRTDTLDLFGGIVAEDFCQKTHVCTSLFEFIKIKVVF